MNESEIDRAEGDGGYESEASLSETDDSEGEVPNVTGDADFTGPLSNRSARAVQDPVWSPKSPTVVTPNVKDGSFTRGWKPVIDGKIQVGGEMATNEARKPPLQAADNVVSSHKKRPSSGNESDSDERRVPEMSSKEGVSVAASAQNKPQSSASRPGKRGGGPADKERKRLKRLLRNRVSAQQARERKKAYLGDLEIRSKELQQRNEELEERVSTLLRENYMLRQIVKNTTGRNKPGGSGNAMDP